MPSQATPKKKGGRPAYEPRQEHRKLVNSLAGFGIPAEEIAKLIDNTNGKPLSKKTLYKYFRAELETGHIKANARVAERLFQIATGDTPQSVTAAIFWLKTRAGWKEADKIKQPAQDEDESVEMPTTIRIVAGGETQT